MKQVVFLFVPLLLLFAGACGDDDSFGSPCVETEFDEPEWREGIVYVDVTNTPTVQIDRFVAANNLDTVQTSSGLVYSISNPGSSEMPVDTSIVSIWYRESVVNGQLTDVSNYCRTGPLRTLLGTRQLAWQEGISKIGIGGEMIILARPSLAYGTTAPSSGTNVLVYEIQLLEIE